MNRAIRILAFFLMAVAVPSIAYAQGAVQQSGTVAYGHIPYFLANGVVADGGPSNQGQVTDVGIVNTGTPLCITDTTNQLGPYEQFCLGLSDSLGASLNLTANNDAPQLPFSLNLNGVSYQFPVSGFGTVTSVGLSLPTIFTITGSPVTTTGTLTAALAGQNANRIFSGPATGSAAAPSFRALVGSDLPNPSATTLGGTESAAAVTHQWINSISTTGVPTLSQPATSDLSGLGTGVVTLLSGASSGTGGPVGTASPSISAPTFTSSVTATGLITNADLANSSLTIAGHAVALGGTQSLATTDLSDVAAPAAVTITDATSSGVTFSSVNVKSYKIGNLVHVYGTFTIGASASSTANVFGGLITTVPNATYAGVPGSVEVSGISVAGGTYALEAEANTTQFNLRNVQTGARPGWSTIAGATITMMLIYPAS